MKQLRVLILTLLALSLPAFGQGQPTAWPDALSVSFTGRGLETGQILDIKVRNSSSQNQRFALRPFTVLVATDPAMASILLESSGEWDILPQGVATFRVTGYCLNRAQKMPAAGETASYTPLDSSPEYVASQAALQMGLRQEQANGFQADLLPPEKHRLLVLQRLIWRVQRDGNPTEPQDLESDLRAAFQSRGETPTDQTIKAVTGSVWRDVDSLYQTLRAEASKGSL